MKLSHSKISCFKACPMRFNLRYVKRLVPAEETDSLRCGSNWHKIQEIFNLKAGDQCPDCRKNPDAAECPICINQSGIVPDGGMDAVVRYLDSAYAVKPISKTDEEWATEQTVLLYSLIGYNWFYQNQQTEYNIAGQEFYFNMPITSPITGRKLPGASISGIIDKILTKPGLTVVKEHKSTSKSLDSSSTYWGHLVLDSQTTLYPMALRASGIEGPIGILYDVWHKPQISPKMLTQADSRAFVETGEYCGQKFEIEKSLEGTFVNGVKILVEPGKKEDTFAIRETPEMFGARLLQDITERPDFYFAVREIPRTEKDFKRFGQQLFNIYQTLRTLVKTDGWWQDESQCEATFKCPYINICYNNVELDPATPPQGYIYESEEK